MNNNLVQEFSHLTEELSNHLYFKGYDKGRVNSLMDELNSKPFKVELFVLKQDAEILINCLCTNIKPEDGFLSTKTSHLINSILTKQNLKLEFEHTWKVISWHIECLKKCSDIVVPDICHNLQCIVLQYPNAALQFTTELIGKQGVLIKLVDIKEHTQNSLHVCLSALKCICSITSLPDEKNAKSENILSEDKERISRVIVNLLMKGTTKTFDEFLYCKVVISSLRVLSQLYFNDQNNKIPMPEVMGICHYYVLYGLLSQSNKPERLMPAQQTIAVAPITQKAGKKQKIRKQRNNAIEVLKKEIPVSDQSLMKDIGNFENNSAYKPANWNYLETQKGKNWVLTSDSDMSDIENGREAKLIALKSRVRQSASNLLLVLIKITEKKDMFGYWWALMPDAPDINNWCEEEASKKTLAYCAKTDPISACRASVLSVVLALLSGSRLYLSQAERSKRENASFTPFSVSLGNMISCMHKVLIGILDSERSPAVILVALKCCAALVQATPYHKLQDGLITDLVRSTRKFLIHRDIKFQVGALIVMGCVLSVDPKVNEIIKAIQKDTAPSDNSNYSKINADDEYDDFEEGYSDDEMFNVGDEMSNNSTTAQNTYYFKSWILDICFKNLGWTFKGNDVVKCKQAAIPVVLESLQVLSAISFHHLAELLSAHVVLLADMFADILHQDHIDVVLEAVRTIPIIGDAIKKLEETDEAPPLNQCVYLWEKLVPQLSTILQCHDSPFVKAYVCDCIANIGERSFQELPRHVQVLCCALLVGSCGDSEATVRAAAVRALAMTVVYRTLREDICFVSDCGENILRALAEPSHVVQVKAAWALGNLSDALVLSMEDPEIDDIDDDLFLRLLEVSIHCTNDNDRVKMSATRSLGNLLRLIRDEKSLRNPRIKTLCETAIGKLLDCACKATNMKARWNACYAIGNAMKNDNLFTCFTGWQNQVFPSLCTIAQECKNLKVRINAATALRSPRCRDAYAIHYTVVWRGVLVAMETAAIFDDFTEYKHKDNLIEQLCVTLAHLCCLLKPSDLSDILDPLIFHHDRAKELLVQMCHRLPPENASCLKILQAAKYVTVDLTPQNETQAQALGILQDIFIWDI